MHSWKRLTENGNTARSLKANFSTSLAQVSGSIESALRGIYFLLHKVKVQHSEEGRGIGDTFWTHLSLTTREEAADTARAAAEPRNL